MVHGISYQVIAMEKEGETSNGEASGVIEELLKGTHACSHTHTCNPPGPSSMPHTHTCVHTHTQLFAQQETTEDSHTTLFRPPDDNPSSPSSFLKKRPLGNREAVKKYREKKKAHIKFLEEQVQNLRVFNQQLLKRLQSHAALEAEVFHLRVLLAELRGRIDGEIGFHSRDLQHPKDPGIMQSLPGGYFLNSFSVPCGAEDVSCLHPFQEEGMVTSGLHRSVLSCQKPKTSCERKQEIRRKQSSKTCSMTVMDCTEDG